MDLRTKLVFGLVAVSLGSMLVLGTLAYTSAEDLLTARSELRLTSLAAAKAEQVRDLVEGWNESVRLIASRTQLRESLRLWNESALPEEVERIDRILADVGAAGVVEGVAVFDAEGRFVTGAGVAASDVDELVGWNRDPGSDVMLGGFTADDPPLVSYAAPLLLGGERVGTLRAVLSTSDLVEVAQNRTGLRETGETLIGTRYETGEIRLLTPTRHEVPIEPASAPGGDLLEQTFAGMEGPISEGLTDYRGEPVWAAMQRIEPGNLGLVVKFDDAEERADVTEYRARILGVGFSVSAFAILLGILMGLSFARPIHELAGVADRIRQGDLSARADDAREDELGVLAGTFNDMSEELERRMSLLQEYKTFFDSSLDLLCIAGTDGYFKRVNPSFERELGWTAGELLETPFLDFIHPDDVEASAREVERLSRGIPTTSFENRMRSRGGSYRRLLWTCLPDPATGALYAAARVLPDPDEF